MQPESGSTAGGPGGLPLIALIAVLGVLGAACQAGGTPDGLADGDPVTPDSVDSLPDDAVADAPSDSLRLGLDVPAEVGAGDPVLMTLRVENVTERPLDLYLMGRAIAFDLIVQDDDAVVWRRLHDETIRNILRVETLAPGDTLVLEDTWNQRSNDGEPVSTGTYTVRGEVLTEGRPLVSEAVPLRIRSND